MSPLASILRRASVTDRAEVRSGEALFAHPRAQGFIAIPAPTTRQAETLALHGWAHAKEGSAPGAASRLLTPTADGPILLATPGGSHAHAITGSPETGFSLLAFEQGSSVVRRRDARSVGELFQPDPEWSEREWAAYASLLDAQPQDAQAFWSLPATAARASARLHLVDTLSESFWHVRTAQQGLSGLVGDSLATLRNRFLDMPSNGWMAETAKQLGLNLDSKQSFDVLLDTWMLARATDDQINRDILPRIRAAHPDAFASWSDDRLLSLWRSCYDAVLDRSTALARIPASRAGIEQETPLNSGDMRTILVDHYGHKVIEALEQAGKLTLLDSGEELPIEIRTHPSQHLIAGVTVRNDHVYLIANRISAAEVPGLFLHEIGEHAGLAEMLGPDYGRMSAHFQRLLREGDAYAMGAAMRVPKTTAPQHIPSERLAYLIEEVANDQAARPGGEEGYRLGQECLSNLRTWLFRTPLCRWLEDISALEDFILSPQDIAGLARESVNMLAGELDSTIATQTNDWTAQLNNKQLDTLFAADPTERHQMLSSLPPRIMAGYLYALATAKAPQILETIEQYSANLNDMATGIHGTELSVVAGEILSQGYALEAQARVTEQASRSDIALWAEPGRLHDQPELKLMKPADTGPGEWSLTHHKKGLGAYMTEHFESLGSATALIGPAAVPLNEVLAPQLLAQWSESSVTESSAAQALARWSAGTHAVNAAGELLVMYHGTGADFTEFEGFTHWATESAQLASEYAALRASQGASPLIIPLYVQARAPFDADALDKRSLTVASFFNEAFTQAKAEGRAVDIEAASELIAQIRACARREESGPYYSPHQLWNQPGMSFGADGAALIKQLLAEMGFDSIKFTELGELTFGVLNPSQLKSATGNSGLYDSSNPNIQYAFGGRTAANACMSKLKEARALHEAGEGAEVIRQATGWFMGHDAKWRFEIDDSQARAKENWSLWRQDKVANRTTLRTLIDHWPLFDAYPHLRHLPVTIDPSLPHGSAAFDFRSHEIYVYPEPGEGRLTLSNEQISAVMHEVQHVIQDFEGFSSGGSAQDQSLPATRLLLQRVNDKYARLKEEAAQSPEYRAAFEARLAEVPPEDRFREGRNGTYDYAQVLAGEAAYNLVVSPIENRRMADIDQLLGLLGPLESLDSRFLAYRLIGGEVEARNVQSRLAMSETERAAAPPFDTEDAPAEYIISWHGREHLVAVSTLTGTDAVPGNEPALDIQFSFAGAKASTANLQELAKAQDRVRREADPELVRQYTGWSVGHDGLWRFEIDDSQAMLIDVPSPQTWEEYAQVRTDAYLKQVFGGRYYGISQLNQSQFKDFITFKGEIEREYNTLNRRHRTLGDLLDHPQLFAAYPPLRAVRVEIDPGMGASAFYNAHTNTIGLGQFPTPLALLKAVLHEGQHALQTIEGFSAGGSPKDFRDVSLVEPKLAEINMKISALMDGNAEFASLQRQINHDFIRINDAYGTRTAEGVSLDWDKVPVAVSEPYFALLDQAERFPERSEYWDLASQRDQVIADDPILSKHEQYRRLAGEVEARNVEARLALTAEQRKNTSPRSTEDYPADAIIVLNGRGVSMSTLEPKRHQTQTPAFESWFDQSKICNEDGTPQVVYHGTEKDFTAFGTEFIGTTSDAGRAPTGAFWFGSHPAVAEYFAMFNEQIMPVYLKMNRPLEVDCKEWARRFDTLDQAFQLNDGTLVYDILMFKHQAIAEAKRDGFDGVVFKGGYDGRPFNADIFATFEPTQMKSAIGNIGSFDAANPDLRMSTMSDPAPGTHDWKSDHVSSSEMMAQLRAEGRLTAITYNGTELTPAHLEALTRQDDLPRPLRAFLIENMDALIVGADVSSALARHTAELERRLATAQQNVTACMAGEQRPLSAVDYDRQARELKADLGWFVVHGESFGTMAERSPVVLRLDAELSAQDPAVSSALSLLRLEGKPSTDRCATGRDLASFLVEYGGGAQRAAQLLSSVGIDCLVENANATGAQDHESSYVVLQRGSTSSRVPKAIKSTDSLSTVSIAELPGVRYASPVDQVRVDLMKSVAQQKDVASARLRTLAERQAWLLSFSSVDDNLITRNRAAIRETVEVRADLNGWKAPGPHNCLPWDEPLSQIQNGLLQLHLLGRDLTGSTGSQVYALLVESCGGDAPARRLLADAGLIGVHSGDQTVLWDGKCTDLAECERETAQVALQYVQDGLVDRSVSKNRASRMSA